MDYLKKAEEMFEYMRQVNQVPSLKELSGITQGEMATLGYLNFEHDGVSAGDLSAILGVGSSRIAAILNALTKKGFAARRPDPNDGRRVLVYITETGRKEALKKHTEALSNLAEFLRLMSPEDAETFMDIIKRTVVAAKKKKK